MYFIIVMVYLLKMLLISKVHGVKIIFYFQYHNFTHDQTTVLKGHL